MENWGLRSYVDSFSGVVFKQMYSKQSLKRLLSTIPGAPRLTPRSVVGHWAIIVDWCNHRSVARHWAITVAW